MLWYKDSATYVIGQEYLQPKIPANFVIAKNLHWNLKQIERSNENDLFLLKISHNASFLTCLLEL